MLFEKDIIDDDDSSYIREEDYADVPLTKQFLDAGKSGAGMFTEAYVIFAVGNLNGSVWPYLYPKCYNKNDNDGCSNQAVSAVPYVEITGIIIGMIGFGLMADHLGRLWGSRMTSSLMLMGAIGVTVAFGIDLSGQFAMFNILIFVYSLGVGGEYPMASSNAAERAEAENLPRGRTVSLTFALQGWGNFINTAVICVLLAITNTEHCTPQYLAQGNSTVCSTTGMQVVWRVQYALIVPVLCWLVWLRFTRLSESKTWEKRQEHDVIKGKSQRELLNQRVGDTSMLYSRKYVYRLIGAAGGWFVWDVAFYGNKLFQNTIIIAIIGGNKSQVSLGNILNYTLLNSFVALCGYYFAAFTIDKKWMGRVRMQNMGFGISAALFLACGYAYPTLSSPSYISLFQFLYFSSSFFGQFGPNVTTWLLPVEVFPTDIRSQAHGICAATGKLGALAATLAFSYGNNGGKVAAADIFIISGYCCLIGLVLTVLFVPDLTNRTLYHIDAHWDAQRHAFVPNGAINDGTEGGNLKVVKDVENGSADDNLSGPTIDKSREASPPTIIPTNNNNAVVNVV